MKLKLLVVFCCIALSVSAQHVKKPTLMILPSDNWCVMRYFTTTFDDQGQKVRVPDYQRAFQEDSELRAAISQLGEILTDYGYSIKDSEQELKSIAVKSAEDENTYSKNGASFSENPLDILKRSSKADIIIQLDWTVHKEKRGNSIGFTLEAFDSYTNKRIATSMGNSKASDEIIPKLLAKTIKEKVSKFDKQLTNHFEDLTINGREIVLTVRCWDSWNYDLETEYGGDELLDCIQNWLSENTVNGNFNLKDATENVAYFEQVRIPMFNDRGKAIDARDFATQLRKYLQTGTFNITSKVLTRGLGEAILILGEK